MRIDLYTKTLLTLIVLLLAVIVLKPIAYPHPVMAQGGFTGMQFSATGEGFWLFDSKTGNVYYHRMINNISGQLMNEVFPMGKVTQPDKKLEK
jgi:hypothetical protein